MPSRHRLEPVLRGGTADPAGAGPVVSIAPERSAAYALTAICSCVCAATTFWAMCAGTSSYRASSIV